MNKILKGLIFIINAITTENLMVIYFIVMIINIFVGNFDALKYIAFVSFMIYFEVSDIKKIAEKENRLNLHIHNNSDGQITIIPDENSKSGETNK